MNKKHAVLYYHEGASTLMWIDGKGFHCEQLAAPCTTLRDLAEVTYKHFVTHLWVMPSYGDFEPMKNDAEWSFSAYENRKHAMMGAAVRKRGHQQIDVNLIFPQYTAWWGTDKNPGWLRAADPHEVLITLHYLEQALGVTVGASPGSVGWSYLKKLHPEWIEDIPGVDLAKCHFTSAAGPDIIWDRALLSNERRKKYIHKFDKGGAYPYSGTQTSVGVGTPVHVLHGDDARHEKGHPQAIGVWRCTVLNTVTFEGMPKPWNKREGWIAGPVIRLLQKTGHDVKIHEGYVFPEQHQLLLKWGTDLWNIRQGFDAPGRWKNVKCARLARQATKFLMNATIGMTAFKGFDEEDEMKRPDIRMQLIARHRELTWHNIDKLHALYGVTPVIVYMDALYLISDNPNGRDAFPELVKRESQFGGYKYEGHIEITPAVLTLFDTPSGEAEKLEELNKIGWTL